MTASVREIEALLREFAAAMSTWERECITLLHSLGREKSPELSDEEIETETRQFRKLTSIFKKYCVHQVAPQRDMTYRDPPDYHPDHFEIVDVIVKGKKATAKVRQPMLVKNARRGPGVYEDEPITYTYHLLYTADGWRLEDRRECLLETSGRVIRTTL